MKTWMVVMPTPWGGKITGLSISVTETLLGFSGLGR